MHGPTLLKFSKLSKEARTAQRKFWEFPHFKFCVTFLAFYSNDSLCGPSTSLISVQISARTEDSRTLQAIEIC